jgi:hypothetical protein
LETNAIVFGSTVKIFKRLYLLASEKRCEALFLQLVEHLLESRLSGVTAHNISH